MTSDSADTSQPDMSDTPAVSAPAFDARAASAAEVAAQLRVIERDNARRADAARNERMIADLRRRLGR